MLRRLRLRRSMWAAIAVGILAAPAILGGGVAATPADAGDRLPPPDLDPRETPPPDRFELESRLVLAQYESIADLAPEPFRSLVVDAANRHKVDPRLLAAIVTVETKWDPSLVGSHGELGLMQILPSTGAYLAREAGLTQYDLADSATNLSLGAQYIADLLEQYGTPERALAAYNGGPDAVATASTNLYAHKVLTYYEARPVMRYSMKIAAS